MTETQTPPSPTRPAPTPGSGAPTWDPRRLLGRLTNAEWIVAGTVAVVTVVLVLLEPDIVEAPVENSRSILFTVGGTVLAALALALMLRFAVPPVLRIVVLLVPFVGVNWWLLSPFFIDDVVDEDFATSIVAELGEDGGPDADGASSEPTDAAWPADEPTGTAAPEEPVDAAPSGPVLLGAGTFVGLAGHAGTGDAGLFQDVDGSYVLRFENFDIENGPDLEVYLVPGADQTSLAAGSIHLGSLAGNVGDQTYELSAGTELAPGPYTALVWCEAFVVEFVGATVVIP